jgi:predicted nucleotidyltransferase
MLEQSILMVIEKYLAAVKDAGIEVAFAVVFGSQVTGNSHEWSDIDLLVVSPLFEDMSDRRYLNLLWHLAGRIDSRIEKYGVKS